MTSSPTIWYYRDHRGLGPQVGPFSSEEKAELDSVRTPGATYVWEVAR